MWSRTATPGTSTKPLHRSSGRLMEPERRRAPVSPLLLLCLLKSGTDDPPVFYCPWVWVASAIDFFSTRQHLETNHLYFGMQARGNRWSGRTLGAHRRYGRVLNPMR